MTTNDLAALTIIDQHLAAALAQLPALERAAKTDGRLAYYLTRLRELLDKTRLKAQVIAIRIAEKGKG